MSLVGFKAQNHPQQRIKDAVDDRGTAPEVFGPLNDRFGFTLDVAAAEHNAKCVRYFDIRADGLRQSWAGERVWCNPPYSNIGAWVEKAWAEQQNCPLIVMLLPANRTEQGWWQDHIEPYRDGANPERAVRVEFLRGRMRFVRPGQQEIGPNERPPFGVCLVIWGRDIPRPVGASTAPAQHELSIPTPRSTL